MGILLIEHIVVNNFSPPVGRILIWIDDAGQGRRFEVVRHLEPSARLKKRFGQLLLLRECVVFQEGISREWFLFLSRLWTLLALFR